MSGPLQGVTVTPLKQIRDDRGSVMHVLRKDSPQFVAFGEVYVSTVRQAVVKAWKSHKIMTQNFAVPSGLIEFVLFDRRESSSTKGQLQRVEVGVDQYSLLHIPPGIWYGFRGLGAGESMIVNCASIPHDPNEVERLPEDSSLIPHRWL